jgi:hypothetical protein
LFSAPSTGEDSKFGTFVHEWSHAVAGTDDIAADRTDANYPSLIGWNWPWLPGRVR